MLGGPRGHVGRSAEKAVLFGLLQLLSALRNCLYPAPCAQWSEPMAGTSLSPQPILLEISVSQAGLMTQGEHQGIPGLQGGCWGKRASLLGLLG